MNGYLNHVLGRALGQAPALRPRPRSAFEPAPAGEIPDPFGYADSGEYADPPSAAPEQEWWGADGVTVSDAAPADPTWPAVPHRSPEPADPTGQARAAMAGGPHRSREPAGPARPVPARPRAAGAVSAMRAAAADRASGTDRASGVGGAGIGVGADRPTDVAGAVGVAAGAGGEAAEPRRQRPRRPAPMAATGRADRTPRTAPGISADPPAAGDQGMPGDLETPGSPVVPAGTEFRGQGPITTPVPAPGPAPPSRPGEAAAVPGRARRVARQPRGSRAPHLPAAPEAAGAVTTHHVMSPDGDGGEVSPRAGLPTGEGPPIGRITPREDEVRPAAPGPVGATPTASPAPDGLLPTVAGGLDRATVDGTDPAVPVPATSRRPAVPVDGDRAVSPPVVNVTIGRIEVRQPPALPAPAAPPPPPGPRPLSLDEYLSRP